MQRTLITIAVLLTANLALSLPASAAVYRWVDDQGVVHFSERVPEGVDATAVNVRPNTVSAVRAETRPRKAGDSADTEGEAVSADPETEVSYAESRRRERAEKRRVNIEQEQELAERCNLARAQKAQSESSPRVLVRDEDGTTRRLPDEERLEILNKANDFLAANCD